MRRTTSGAGSLILAAALISVPASLSAQARFLVAGGLSQPTGDFADVVDSGFHGTLGLEAGFPLSPVSFRVEAGADRFPAAGSASGHVTTVAASVSVVLSLGGVGLSPYLIGGVGSYRTSYSSEFGSTNAPTDTGYHGGLGVSLGALGFGGFAEARFVSISAAGPDKRYIPITVGVRF